MSVYSLNVLTLKKMNKHSSRRRYVETNNAPERP